EPTMPARGFVREGILARVGDHGRALRVGGVVVARFGEQALVVLIIVSCHARQTRPSGLRTHSVVPEVLKKSVIAVVSGTAVQYSPCTRLCGSSPPAYRAISAAATA